MKCIILAAGYATRLYPLTKDRAKPLLEVAEKPIIVHILEKIEKVDSVDEVIVVTNDKFYGQFSSWAEQYSSSKKITIINDGTTTNDNRLGAIGDIQYVLEQLNIQDDLMVLAGDNLFDFELTDYVEFFKHVGTDCITAYKEDNMDQLKRAGVVEIDEEGKVLSFEEKPQNPKSEFRCTSLLSLSKRNIAAIFTIFV